MKIIFIRHGQAQIRSTTGQDSDRELTEFGQQQAKQTAKYILDNYQPDLFIVSPYQRAKQTLKAFTDRTSTVPYTVLDEITPNGDPKVAIEIISSMVDTNETINCVVVVCHMPIVAEIVGELVGQHPTAYQLAEARVLECAFVVENLCNQVDGFIPQQS